MSKSIHEYDRLLNWTLSQGGDRKSVMIAIGGVIGDLAGFVAASFARGIRFVQVPPRCQRWWIEKGGKTGINLPDAKNMVGCSGNLPGLDRYGRTLYVTRTQLLEWSSRNCKYGVIDDADFFHWLEKNASYLLIGRFIAMPSKEL